MQNINEKYVCVVCIDDDPDDLTTFSLLDGGEDEEDDDVDGGVFNTFDVPQFEAGKCCWPPPRCYRIPVGMASR